jgi:hypothetical protein
MEKTAPSQYRSILVPSYASAAKRAILDHGYLSSLHNPKAKLIRSQSLTIIGTNQVAGENGIGYPADLIILANGFKTAQLLTPMSITGVTDSISGIYGSADLMAQGRTWGTYLGDSTFIRTQSRERNTS